MKKVYFTTLIGLLFLLTNCQNTEPDYSVSSATKISVKDTISAPITKKADSIPAPDIVLNAKRKEKTPLSKKVDLSIDEEIQRQLKLNPDLPQLNSVADAYNNITVKMFSGIADASGGEVYMIDNAKFVVDAISDIIKTYMSGETDLVFLVDKTGSMSDDIAEIKTSISKIVSQIKTYENTRVGFVFYGDKNADIGLWFEKYPLTNNYDTLPFIINGITTTGGGDYEESVNDAIAKTIEEMNWITGRKRIVLLIGDAPSLLPPRSNYSMEQIITMAKDARVNMNFYPVVIGIKGNIDGIGKPKEIVTSKTSIITDLYPNPASDFISVAVTNTGKYRIEIFDINGVLITTKQFHSSDMKIATNTFASGVYVLRIYNEENSTIDTKKFVVKH